MLKKSALGFWGVEMVPGMDIGIFIQLANLAGYLNNGSPAKPSKAELDKLPPDLIKDVRSLLKD